MMRLRPSYFAVLLLAAGGCQDGKDLKGRWTFSFPPTSMDLTLSEDGKYSGIVESGMGQSATTGTYAVSDDTLFMSVPTVAGARGLPAPFGGQLRLKMSFLSAGMVRLSDGAHEYAMQRTSY